MLKYKKLGKIFRPSSAAPRTRFRRVRENRGSCKGGSTLKLLTYEVDRRKDIGVMSRDEMWVYPLRAFGMEYTSMMEVVKGFSQSEKDLLEHVSGLEPYGVTGAAMRSEVKILAPIEAPDQDIMCLGLNYMEHAEESARVKKEALDGVRMIFDIDHIVSELSMGMTLKAGTIISTGTPSGVGMGFTPPKFLKAGDVVECVIEGIGSIKNTVSE